MKDNYCVIMGGGIGSRFWPFSRESYPKQFLDFFGTGRSLLQMTFDRFAKIIPVEKCQGLSFRKRDFVIVDEAQNCEVSQIKALVTRPERCSQMVICGDDTQSALNKENGLEYLLKVWEEKQSLLQNFQGVFRFEVKECQRKGIAAVYTGIFEEEGAWTKSKKVEKKVEPDSLVHKNDEGVQGHLREE